MILRTLSHSVLQSLTNFNEDFTSSWVNCTIRYLGTKTAFPKCTKKAKEYQNGSILKTHVNISPRFFLLVNSVASEVQLCIMLCARMQTGGSREGNRCDQLSHGLQNIQEQWAMASVTVCRLQRLQRSFLSLFLSFGKFLPYILG